VLLEALRQRWRHQQLSSDHVATSPPTVDADSAEHNRAIECLERCLEACTPSERQLIVEYYKTESGSASATRRHLAQRLGLTANSLAIRACRIRSRLERCVRACRER
jgi:DNA-directed RNA polymerase specialized sigma24 family protein